MSHLIEAIFVSFFDVIIIMLRFSQEQLIQYVYSECSPILKLAIEKAMLEDIALQKEVKALKRTIKQLSKLEKQSPKKSTIDSIIKYAEESQKKK